jgi:hypothetical protein
LSGDILKISDYSVKRLAARGWEVGTLVEKIQEGQYVFNSLAAKSAQIPLFSLELQNGDPPLFPLWINCKNAKRMLSAVLAIRGKAERRKKSLRRATLYTIISSYIVSIN